MSLDRLFMMITQLTIANRSRRRESSLCISQIVVCFDLEYGRIRTTARVIPTVFRFCNRRYSSRKRSFSLQICLALSYVQKKVYTNNQLSNIPLWPQADLQVRQIHAIHQSSYGSMFYKYLNNLTMNVYLSAY